MQRIVWKRKIYFPNKYYSGKQEIAQEHLISKKAHYSIK